MAAIDVYAPQGAVLVKKKCIMSIWQGGKLVKSCPDVWYVIQDNNPTSLPFFTYHMGCGLQCHIVYKNDNF